MNNNSIFFGTVTSFRPNKDENDKIKFNKDGSLKAYLSVYGPIDKIVVRNEDGSVTTKTNYSNRSFEIFIPKDRISHGPNGFSLGRFDQLYAGMPIAVEYQLGHDQYERNGVTQYRDYLKLVDMNLFEEPEILAELRPIRQRRIDAKRAAKQQRMQNQGQVYAQNYGYGQPQPVYQQAPVHNYAQNTGYSQTAQVQLDNAFSDNIADPDLPF